MGLLSEQGMTESVRAWKEQMALGGRPIKSEEPSDIYDFSLVRRAHEEIKAEGWDAKKYQYVPKNK
jgi:hypothetical protein